MLNMRKTLTLGARKKTKEQEGSVTRSKRKVIVVPKKESERPSPAPTCDNSQKRHRKVESKNKHKLALRKLEKEFPKIFNLNNPRPLEKGIREDILKKDKSISNKAVRLGLFFYCNSHQYLSSIKEGVQRVNHTGRYTKPVTQQEEDEAKAQLRALVKSIKSARR